ncbi:MAG TPA: hypothetical protein VIH90_03345 [Candidatus Saccharimonadales bacterium]
MLEKLENTYLSILRFVVIAVSGCLLIAFIFLAIGSLGAFKSAPSENKKPPQLTEQVIIKGVLAKNVSEQPAAAASDQEDTKEDPNKVQYDRAATVIGNFVSKYTTTGETVGKQAVVNIVKGKAEAQNEPEYVAAYAKTFADSMEKGLANPQVIEAVKSSSTLDVVNRAMSVFTTAFMENVRVERLAIEKKENQYSKDKVAATTSLYMAGGAFAAFLLIVFLSIFIKIERNLRKLEIIKA